MKKIKEESFSSSSDPAFAIYQLKEEKMRDYGFQNMSTLKKEGKKVKKDNYKFVYASYLTESPSARDVLATLEGLFTIFNCEHPKDYKGHSLSVSDVIVLRKITDKGPIELAYFCDSFGFEKIQDWEKEGQLKVIIPPHEVRNERYELRFYRKDKSFDRNPAYGFDCDSKGNLFMRDVDIWGPNYLEAISSDEFDPPRVEEYYSVTYQPGYYQCGKCGYKFRGVFLPDTDDIFCPECGKVYPGSSKREV